MDLDEVMWMYTPGCRLTLPPDNGAIIDNLCPRHLGPFHGNEVIRPGYSTLHRTSFIYADGVPQIRSVLIIGGRFIIDFCLYYL